MDDEIITDKEREDVRIATLYDLRLQIKGNEKEKYTKQEVLEFLDNVALEILQK